jgi:ABC-type transport system involved in multi-copper enzyme maturation permease subunit
LTVEHLVWAAVIAVVISFILAAVEIPGASKASARACANLQTVLYWVVLSIGNTLTTLLASTAIASLPATLLSFDYFLSACFGVFGFEVVLKNTNITMFDKGVLTIQDWIDKAKNAAVAEAIKTKEQMKSDEEEKLVQKLMKLSNAEINTRILTKMGAGTVPTLDTAAQASKADPKLYKAYQLVTTMSDSERQTALKS